MIKFTEKTKFVISLAIAILFAYSLIITGLTFHFAGKARKLDRELVSVELMSQNMGKKIKAISAEISNIEKQRANLQQKLTSVDEDSKKKAEQLLAQITQHKNTGEKLKTDLRNAKHQVANLEKKNQRLESSSDKSEKNRAEYERLKGVLMDKETELQMIKASIAALEKTVKMKEANVHYNLAVNFFQRQDFSNALIEYIKALDISPDHHASHYNLGVLYEEYAKDYAKAINHYREYLRIRPDADDVSSVKEWILALESKLPQVNAK